MRRLNGYSYRATLKSQLSDELINTYVLRPMAGVLVRLLYPTAVSPNQVTVAATVWGVAAALLYAQNSALHTALAGVCLTMKDLFDSADGQLARARKQYTRTGRFLDSIGDILVNALVFTAITGVLWTSTADPAVLALGVLGFLGISLRVSYHVYYQTSFLHLHEKYGLNRTTEEMQQQDLLGDPAALRLQRIFLALYGWQDRLVLRIDRWCRGKASQAGAGDEKWFGDPIALRLSGFLGMGTELMLLTVCSLADALHGYLMANLFGMNAVWCVCVVYRRTVLRNRLKRSGG